jgi:hypothetical protein
MPANSNGCGRRAVWLRHDAQRKVDHKPTVSVLSTVPRLTLPERDPQHEDDEPDDDHDRTDASARLAGDA